MAPTSLSMPAPFALPIPAGLEMTPAFQTRAESIVGGTTAAAGEFPYIVSLSRSGSHFCGGVLLNANTVVTAAHCSVGQSASNVRVRAGTLTWASGGTQVGVTTIIVHPSYNSARIDNDVAVWKLATSLQTSSTIGYATLPVQGSDPVSGSLTTTAGWGTTSQNSGSLPAALRRVDVPVISRTSCRSSYGTSAVTTNMFCAGLSTGGKDSCSGDSGGPIVDASTKVLLGLVSWGNGCAQASYPGVYTRLGQFVTFVKSYM
ncbi:serine endopeptidase [Amylocarpus encephaloides]|uniref:Serine endopeptidase n=1 Tax=Amylocarpus encephaloides TaxID=45428 RepID=A0A9P8C132_9HELO|nr:serine endopeptidase [Amylocarpus encephaloides]